jgi:disulfide oxidoreductase YuzD
MDNVQKVNNCIGIPSSQTFRSYIKAPLTNKYSRRSIYQMKCLDCPIEYLRQTGRIFSTGYKEHIHAI